MSRHLSRTTSRTSRRTTTTTFFSYKDGRRLGNFKTQKEAFKKFPSERKAFNKVMRFNRKTGKNITTVKQITVMKRKMRVTRRWDK